MSPVWCYCTKVSFILKHNILFIFFLSWTLILGNSDGWTGWSWRYLAKLMILIQWLYECEWLDSPLKALLFPGLCKTLVLPHHSPKCNFGLYETHYSIIYSLQELSFHPRQGISHIYEPIVLVTSWLACFDFLGLKQNVKTQHCSLRITKVFNHTSAYMILF